MLGVSFFRVAMEPSEEVTLLKSLPKFL